MLPDRATLADIIAPEARISLEREQEWCRKYNKDERNWCRGVRRTYNEALAKADAILVLLNGAP